MRVIAFAGNLGSGKDTAAERVAEVHGFTRIGLADPLKRLGASAFDFTFQQLWGPSDFRNAVDKRYGLGEGRYDYKMPTEEWQYAEDRLRIDGQHWLEDDVFAFTDKVNQAVAHAKLMGWFEWLREAHPNLSPRVMLQTLGTEYGREALYESVWIDIGLETSRRLLSGKSDPETRLAATKYIEKYGLVYGDVSKWQGKGVIIPDVRFPNELRAIKEAGGQIWRIYRPETDGKATDTGVAGHASETSLDSIPDSEYSGIINNDGTLEEFYGAIDVAAGIAMSAG